MPDEKDAHPMFAHDAAYWEVKFREAQAEITQVRQVANELDALRQDAERRATTLAGKIDRCTEHLRAALDYSPQDPDAGLESLAVQVRHSRAEKNAVLRDVAAEFRRQADPSTTGVWREACDLLDRIVDPRVTPPKTTSEEQS